MSVEINPPPVYQVVLNPAPVHQVSLVGIPGPAGAPGVGVLNESSISKVAGQDLGGGRVVIVSHNLTFYADHTETQNRFLVAGVTKHAAQANTYVLIQTFGVMSDPAWNWTVGQPLFLGTNGLLVQTVPTTGFLLIIAKAITPTDIFISIEQPILLGG